MKNFSKDKHALSIPWVESPFFYELLKNSNLSKKEKEMCINYHEKGYAIIDLNLSDNEIQQVVDDMYKALDNEKTKFHADHFQYTESRRIFELWKQSKPAAELCLNKKVIDTLRDNSRTELPIYFKDSKGDFVPASSVETNNIEADFLFSYRPIPGTLVFIGYGSALTEPRRFRFDSVQRNSDGFFMKVSYLFQN